MARIFVKNAVKTLINKRCLSCFRPKTSGCVCHLIEQKIETYAKIVLLMHPRELKKQHIGTGRLCQSAIADLEIVIGIDFKQSTRVQTYLENNPCFLIYPSKDAFKPAINNELVVSHNIRPVIFLIDASWPCAMKILRLNPYLLSLPKLSIDSTGPSRFDIRKQPHENCLSTLEATAKYIEQWEFKSGALLEKIFGHWVDFQIKTASDPSRKGYRRSKYKLPADRPTSKKWLKKRAVFENT